MLVGGDAADRSPQRFLMLAADLVRATIHLATARDFLRLRPVVQPVLERDVYPNPTYGRERLEGLDMAAVLAAGRELLEEKPRTNAELRRLLGPGGRNAIRRRWRTPSAVCCRWSTCRHEASGARAGP